MEYIISWQTPSNDTIDLTDYGHEEETTWENLSSEEQDEILDSLREQIIPMTNGIRKVDF